jgi:hypothetical protein
LSAAIATASPLARAASKADWSFQTIIFDAGLQEREILLEGRFILTNFAEDVPLANQLQHQQVPTTRLPLPLPLLVASSSRYDLNV